MCRTRPSTTLRAWLHQVRGSDTWFLYLVPSNKCLTDLYTIYSEGVTIPKNPRTERSVGYAFVDLSTPTEAERAIAELSGKEILERKVSVQLARKPEASADKPDANGEGEGEGARHRQSTRGRGSRGLRHRGGRAGNRGREVSAYWTHNIPIIKAEQG